MITRDAQGVSERIQVESTDGKMAIYRKKQEMRWWREIDRAWAWRAAGVIVFEC